MQIIKFALRRIRSHWRLYFFVLLGLTFCSGLLAGLPIYSQATASRSLRKSLDEGYTVDRNIEIFGSNQKLTGGLFAFVDENIGDLITTRLVIRRTALEAHNQQPVLTNNSRDILPPNFIRIWSVDKLKSYTHLVAGQWPEYTPPSSREEILRAMTKPPDIQAVIGLKTAQDFSLTNGDVIVDASGRHYPIVGIIEPIDPNDDAWWGDKTLFEVYRIPGINEDTVYISLIIHPSWLRESFPSHETTWRILIKQDEIIPENILSIEHRLINLKNGVDSSNATLRTNLPNLLKNYRENISTTRIVISLLSSQSFLFILYSLVLIESLIWERAHNEFSTLIGRGSGVRQLVAILGVEGLMMAIISGLISGPILAGFLLFIWSRFSGGYFESPVNGEGIRLSIIGSGIGWIVLLVGSISISRSNILSWRRRISRQDQSSFWQKHFLDFLLLCISGLMFWQLTNSGSFVMQRIGDTDVSDPLLLLSPTLFLFSISILFMRFYPYILGILFKIFQQTRGIVLPISFLRLSRNPIRPSHIILLISVATSTILFSGTYENSLMINQNNIAHYLAGADIRIYRSDLSADELIKIPGVLNVTHVFRHVAQTRSGKTMTIVGVDPITLPKITSYPPGMTNLTIQKVVDALEYKGFDEAEKASNSTTEAETNNPYINTESTNPPLPGVFSFSALPPTAGIGEQQEITLLGTPIIFNVRGLIRNFPTVRNLYVLTDIAALEQKMDLERSQFHRDHEIWLSVDPERYLEILNIPFIQEQLISDFNQELRSLQDNAFTEGALGAFRLNSFILILLSVIIFSLLIYFSASKRKYEFGILRAEGLSSQQLFQVIFTEGLIIIFLGTIIGTAIGVGLVFILRPYLNIALMGAFPQMVVYKLYFDRQQIIIQYTILIISYLLSLIFVIWSLTRVGIHQVMRIGDE